MSHRVVAYFTIALAVEVQDAETQKEAESRVRETTFSVDGWDDHPHNVCVEEVEIYLTAAKDMKKDWLIINKLGETKVFAVRNSTREEAIQRIEEYDEFEYEEDMDGDYVIIAEIPPGICREVEIDLE